MPTTYVHNGNFEKAIRKFKKQVSSSGILTEAKARQCFEKPTTKRARAKAAARRRWLKQLRLQRLPKSKY